MNGSNQKTSSRTQDFLLIESVSDGIVFMKDQSLRAMLLVSSLNFALKSSEEQDATIFQYQQFLNSLDFSVQIVVQSRRLNIKLYLDILEEFEKKQQYELLRMQIREYVDFVKTFVEEAKIVTKSFFVVVPYVPTIAEKKRGLLQSFLPQKNKPPQEEAVVKREEYKTQLWQRVDVVITGLQRSGLRAIPLNTDELIELTFRVYNPSELERKAPRPTA